MQSGNNAGGGGKRERESESESERDTERVKEEGEVGCAHSKTH